jgi:hypothetical protein
MLHTVETPALVLDVNRFERDAARMRKRVASFWPPASSTFENGSRKPVAQLSTDAHCSSRRIPPVQFARIFDILCLDGGPENPVDRLGDFDRVIDFPGAHDPLARSGKLTRRRHGPVDLIVTLGRPIQHVTTGMVMWRCTGSVGVGPQFFIECGQQSRLPVEPGQSMPQPFVVSFGGEVPAKAGSGLCVVSIGLVGKGSGEKKIRIDIPGSGTLLGRSYLETGTLLGDHLAPLNGTYFPAVPAILQRPSVLRILEHRRRGFLFPDRGTDIIEKADNVKVT